MTDTIFYLNAVLPSDPLEADSQERTRTNNFLNLDRNLDLTRLTKFDIRTLVVSSVQRMSSRTNFFGSREIALCDRPVAAAALAAAASTCQVGETGQSGNKERETVRANSTYGICVSLLRCTYLAACL